MRYKGFLGQKEQNRYYNNTNSYTDAHGWEEVNDRLLTGVSIIVAILRHVSSCNTKFCFG